jgi:hypothetical protein
MVTSICSAPGCSQPGYHRLGQIDTVYANATLGERERDPSGTDSQLKRRTVEGQIGK